jgi:transcriptional regulator with XRE-family HTH domain
MERTTVGVRLGARIRARREALGWSQAKLAEVVELTPNYIGILERGEALPTVQTLLILGGALDASPTDLLGAQATTDDWLDRVVALAAAIPTTQRPLVLGLLQAVVNASPRQPSKKRASPKK